MAAVSCSNPAGPTPPPPSAPALACPADIQTGAVEATVVVEYPSPQATGGTAPVAVSCTVPSGGAFGVGTTSIVCTATDSVAQTAQCTFRVNVSLIPRLKGTRIVAFGDSVTAGVVSPPPSSSVLTIDLPNSYPSVLRPLLQNRYTSQEVVVINEGLPGEQVLGTGSTSNGEDRLERVVLQYRPDVLIVMEGVNGLSVSNAEDVSEGLRRAVRRAKSDGVPLVLVSTILPGVDGRTKPPDSSAVAALNAEIRAWVAGERAVLVDSFASFEPQKELLIGQDGLHPTVDGYIRLAEIFRDAIQAHFEEPSGGTPPATSRSSFGRAGSR